MAEQQGLAWLKRFETKRKDPGYLLTKRAEGLASFNARGIPTTADEDWKYTNIREHLSYDFQPANQGGSVPQLGEALGAFRLVILNGVCHIPAVLPDGISLTPITEAGQERIIEENFFKESNSYRSAFVGLNTATFSQGLLLIVQKEVQEVIEIVHLVSAAEPVMNADRLCILAESGSKAQVVERFVGPDSIPYFTNAVTEVVVRAGAALSHVKIVLEGSDALHLGSLFSHGHRDSNFSSLVVSLRGAMIRNEVNPTLHGTNVNTALRGLSLGRGTMHIDNHTVLDHATPHCESIELFKGIYDEQSKGVFNGTIIVRPDAQKTNAIQSNQTLLLSLGAQVETRPQLKIWADDVKCTHGATVGYLEEEGLFYLQARGIDPQTARGMLVEAFAQEVVEEISCAPLRDEVRLRVQEIIR